MKKNVFTDGDSWLNSGLSRLFDVIVLGLLTTLLCIPVITIGAAITANMDAMIRFAMKKDEKVYKRYFEAFRKNFLKSTLIWLIMLVVGVLVLGAAYMSYIGVGDVNSTMRIVLVVFTLLMVLLYGFTFTYVFALQSRYENKVTTTILNALLISLSNFPKSVVLFGLTVGLTVLGYIYIGLIPLFVILEFTVVTFIAGKLIVPIFAKLGDAEAAGEEVPVEEEAEEETVGEAPEEKQEEVTEDEKEDSAEKEEKE